MSKLSTRTWARTIFWCFFVLFFTLLLSFAIWPVGPILVILLVAGAAVYLSSESRRRPVVEWLAGWDDRIDTAAEARAAHSVELAEKERERAAARKTRVTNQANAQVRRGDKKIKAPISQVGDRSGGGLACPKCGGTQFKAKRSGKNKIASIGAAPLTGGASLIGLAKASQVKCVTCGTFYKRG